MAIKLPIVSEFNKKGIREAEMALGNFGKNVGVAFAAVGAAAIGAGFVIGEFAAKSISAAENVRQADDRLKQVATSMALFGSQTAAVSQRLIDFAEANELTVAVDAEVIKQTQAKLLTFAQLAKTADETGGAFDRATVAALDLAATGFGSAESNATQLGKALQDPIKGLTALGRAGVTFTAQEKEKIKALVESGKTLQAQDLILKAIEKQVGGTAEATAKSSDKMKLAFENVTEQVGKALLPVFDQFVTVLSQLTPQIGDALAPIAEYLAEVFRTKVLPAVQDFTKWLASPAGTKKVQEFTEGIFNGITQLVNFTTAVADNWQAIKNAAISIAAAVVVYKTLTTAIQLATAAQLLLNVAITTNPIGAFAQILAIALTGIVAAGTALTAFTDQNKKAREASTGLTGRLGELVGEQKRLKELLDNGVISYKEYKKAIGPVNTELGTLQGQMMRAAGYGKALNQIKLGSLKNELSDVAGEANRFKNLLGSIKPAAIVDDTTTTSGEPTAAEKAAEARKKVQDLIRDTRKKVIEAQADYRKAVSTANTDFLANEVKIQKDYANKLGDIIQQSQDRITDTFKSVASYTVATFLGSFAAAEQARLQSFEEAKQVAKDLGKAFTDVFTAGDPVKAYLDSLRNKINENKKILDTSAKLLEAGFSQTFIEQIIATGQDGGLALAEGILASNPAVVREIQTLFKDIENVSTTGADSLAKKLYEQQGLATAELNTLYEKTQSDLLDALAANFTDYTNNLADAASVLKGAMTEITTDFNEAIDEMAGKLGGLEQTVIAFRKMLGGVYDATTAATKPLMPSGSSNKTNGVTPFVFDIDRALGQAPGTYASTNNKPQTVINVNVSTDATQSNAMVGKAIDTVIKTYTRTGGGGGGSAQVAV